MLEDELIRLNEDSRKQQVLYWSKIDFVWDLIKDKSDDFKAFCCTLLSNQAGYCGQMSNVQLSSFMENLNAKDMSEVFIRVVQFANANYKINGVTPISCITSRDSIRYGIKNTDLSKTYEFIFKDRSINKDLSVSIPDYFNSFNMKAVLGVYIPFTFLHTDEKDIITSKYDFVVLFTKRLNGMEPYIEWI